MTDNIWEDIHVSHNYPESFSNLLKEEWERASINGVPYRHSTLPHFSLDTLSILKQRSLRLYAYANRCMSIFLGQQHNSHIVFAVFNPGGILLKLYGDPDAISSVEASGISRLSEWNADSIGPTAVSIGLQQLEPACTIGNENYCQALSNKAIYFAPCIVEHTDGSVADIIGGIAIIVPSEIANPDYMMICMSCVYDINLHFFMSGSLEQSLASNERSVLNIDENMLTGKKYVLYCDSNLFNVLGTDPADIFFHPLETLIDPPPANGSFWNIVNSRQVVNDYLINITSHGHTENVQITTVPYYQKKLRIKGIRIFFTSLKLVSKQISKHIGNNAFFTFDSIICQSESYRSVISQARTIAKSDKNILITGEIGTGKTILAQSIHNASPRAGGPFISVACGSLPREQLIKIMFGQEDPAAHEIVSVGYFELANKGTLFLSELGLLPIEFQTILLAAIESKTFYRSGGQSPIYSDVRIIASNSNGLMLGSEGNLRTEYFYLLNAFKLVIPPLRDRKQDISLLADHFIKSFCSKIKIPSKYLSPDAKRYIQMLHWPGNIRELENAMETAVLMTSSSCIEREDLAPLLMSQTAESGPIEPQTHGAGISINEIKTTLQICNNNKSLAAEKLGISRRTLYRYLGKSPN